MNVDMDMVFCHNDICFNNVLKLSPERLMLIDYEDVNYNYRYAHLLFFFKTEFELLNLSECIYLVFFVLFDLTRSFDIGNYFAQCMLNSAHPEPPFFRYTFEHYPSREQQTAFVRIYVETLRQLSSDISSTRLDVDKLVLEANWFALASLLLWAYWLVVQAPTPNSDFDYLGYALVRCDAYLKIKAQLELEKHVQ